jgi:hypothetical protein
VTDVGVGIDPGNDKVDLVGKAQQRQRDAIRGRAVRGKCHGAICQQRFVDAQRSLECLDVPGSGPVAIRREDGHLTDLAHGLRQGQESGRLHAIIIGYQNVHESISDFGFRLGGRAQTVETTCKQIVFVTCWSRRNVSTNGV